MKKNINKKGLVRYQMTCPHCGQVSYQEVLLKDFTWTCPHCGTVNHFNIERGTSITMRELVSEAVEEYKKSQKGKNKQ